jgi:iron(III) transport system ATP-binding protein
VATLLVTHDPDEALLVSDIVSVILAGRIEQTGAPREIYLQPRTLHVAEIFGPVNRISGVIQAGGVCTPWGLIPAPSFREGGRVVVIVRPESLLLHDASQSGSAPARVRRISLRGEVCGLEMELATGQTLLAAAPSHLDWTPGATVHVSLAQDRAVVLPDPHAERGSAAGSVPSPSKPGNPADRL